MTHPACIAIDGPVAAGKSVVGRLVAERLGYRFLDTGLMYRAVTWLALRESVDPEDSAALGDLAEHMSLEWEASSVGARSPRPDRAPAMDGDSVAAETAPLQDTAGIIAAGAGREQPRGAAPRWPTDADLHSAEVDAHVSRVSQHAAVRRVLVERQRMWAAAGKAVVVGRDIGTVVLPNAPLKVYLMASAAERARRRWLERRASIASNLAAMEADIEARDAFDSAREVAPLRPAADAVTLDTDGLSVEAVVERILELAADP